MNERIRTAAKAFVSVKTKCRLYSGGVDVSTAKTPQLMIEVRLAKAITIDRIKIEDLPSDWRDIAARERLRAIGTEWARRRGSAVLAVPSVVIPAEINYLLNPLHPDFRRIKICKPQRFETDLRLIKTA